MKAFMSVGTGEKVLVSVASEAVKMRMGVRSAGVQAGRCPAVIARRVARRCLAERRDAVLLDRKVPVNDHRWSDVICFLDNAIISPEVNG